MASFSVLGGALPPPPKLPPRPPLPASHPAPGLPPPRPCLTKSRQLAHWVCFRDCLHESLRLTRATFLVRTRRCEPVWPSGNWRHQHGKADGRRFESASVLSFFFFFFFFFFSWGISMEKQTGVGSNPLRSLFFFFSTFFFLSSSSSKVVVYEHCLVTLALQQWMELWSGSHRCLVLGGDYHQSGIVLHSDRQRPGWLTRGGVGVRGVGGGGGRQGHKTAYIIIIIHSFYIALFSALKQTHCAHWHVIRNEWLKPFMNTKFEDSRHRNQKSNLGL